MSSFQRQLNLYGFRRISLTEEIRGSYYHRSFQRGRLDLLGEVRRDTIKSGKSKSDGSLFDDCISQKSSSCDDSVANNRQPDAKKPKISQYREYLNSCAVPYSPPISSPPTSTLAGPTTEMCRFDNLYSSNQYHQPMMMKSSYMQSSADQHPMKTNTYRQTSESMKSIQDVFMNQMNNSHDDYFRAAQSISTTVPNLMYNYDNSNTNCYQKPPMTSGPAVIMTQNNGLPSQSFIMEPPPQVFMGMNTAFMSMPQRPAPIGSSRLSQNLMGGCGFKRSRTPAPVMKLSPSLLNLINPAPVENNNYSNNNNNNYSSYPMSQAPIQISSQYENQNYVSDMNTNKQPSETNWGYFDEKSPIINNNQSGSNVNNKHQNYDISNLDLEEFPSILDADELQLFEDLIEPGYNSNNW